MPEPTRYYVYRDLCSVCYCTVDEDENGDYVEYSDYAALRKLAEAVVKEWHKARPSPELRATIETLEEYLK